MTDSHPRRTTQVRRPFSHSAFLIPPFVILLVSGCRDTADRSPPQVLYGQTECELCRMIISEERFAAALVFQRDGRVEKPAFDDLGCLLDYIEKRQAPHDSIPYTHDLDSSAWIDARRAHFVHADALETPMASGLAAFAGVEPATALAKRHAGRTLSFADLLNERGIAAWE